MTDWSLPDSLYYHSLDLQFAKSMMRLCGRQYESEAGEYLCRLLSYQLRHSHVCLELTKAIDPFPILVNNKENEEQGKERARRLLLSPQTFEWLNASPIVIKADQIKNKKRPLVWDEAKGKLYLWRHYDDEVRLVRLLKKLCSSPGLYDVAALSAKKDDANMLHQIFYDNNSSLPGENNELDFQQLALCLSFIRPFLMISGGPGTGKTHTIVKILSAHLKLNPELRFALAAPTGKAAMRISQSMSKQGFAFELPEVLTLQRLLGQSKDGNRFAYHAQNPLELDLLIVDEASMIDLFLFVRMLEALGLNKANKSLGFQPDSSFTRLVILGDHHQLASVGSGSVFAELCGNKAYFDNPTAKAVKDIFELDMQNEKSLLVKNKINKGNFLANSLVVLNKNYRFSQNNAISAFTHYIRNEQQDKKLADILNSLPNAAKSKDNGLDFFNSTLDLFKKSEKNSHLQAFANLVRQGFAKCLKGELVEMLEALRSFCVLAPMREGPQGVNALNDYIMKILEQAGLLERTGGQPRVYPILISENDHQLSLFNGDLGLVVQDYQQQSAYFYSVAASDGPLRKLPLQILPRHEMSFAMTVHKSQGSEFDSLVFVLPEKPHPLISRQLVYTALTRSRHKLSLFASPQALEKSLANSTIRSSGLADRLKNHATFSR